MQTGLNYPAIKWLYGLVLSQSLCQERDWIILLWHFVQSAYFLFAYSSLIGLMSFTPVAISSLTMSKKGINIIRFFACFIFVPLGILCLMSGQSLDNLWSFVDVAAALMCFANIYFLVKGRKTIINCFKNYERNPEKRFVAEEIGVDSDVWK